MWSRRCRLPATARASPATSTLSWRCRRTRPTGPRPHGWRGSNWRPTAGAIIEQGVAKRLDPQRLDHLYEFGIDEVSSRQHGHLTIVANHLTPAAAYGPMEAWAAGRGEGVGQQPATRRRDQGFRRPWSPARPTPRCFPTGSRTVSGAPFRRAVFGGCRWPGDRGGCRSPGCDGANGQLRQRRLLTLG